MAKSKTNTSARRTAGHWLRDGLTLLDEAFLWVACIYAASLLLGTKPGATPLPQWLKHYGWGLALLFCATRFIPNNAYSRTARRDEVVAQAMKTALAVSVLAFAIFTERDSLLVLSCLLFFLMLTAERLILNSLFIRYLSESEHGVIIAGEDTVWQQKALQQNTYGLKLDRLEEQTAEQLEAYLAAHPEAESVYCSLTALSSKELVDVAHTCRKQGVMLHLLPQPAYPMNRAMLSECRGSVNVLSPAKLPLQSLTNRVVKRLTDILGGAVGCLCTGVIFLFHSFASPFAHATTKQRHPSSKASTTPATSPSASSSASRAWSCFHNSSACFGEA